MYGLVRGIHSWLRWAALLAGIMAASAAFTDFGAAMRTPQLRYWVVEHITLMIVAVAVIHVGRVLARKKSDPAAAVRQRAIFFSLTVISMLVTIPRPGTTNGRPLFRGL